ncbi:hypothetical protein [Vibrio harveyi]|uniref:hypothetical protein n=1 Tax=Vibrio harveyi TaxID=669 RepID=UPI0002C48406|nr:hypothetical protein [Vibrio harveyi]EMR34031.1 hypothetical protein MUQ_25765 [Vibrio harveyi CAIM 1792]
MNQHKTKTIGQLTTDINTLMQSHVESGSNNTYLISSTSELLKSYTNIVFHNNFKQSVEVIKNLVISNNEIMPFCEDMVRQAMSQHIISARTLQPALSGACVAKYRGLSNTEEHTDLVLFGVLADFVNHHQNYFVGNERFGLFEEMQRVCLVMMLINLEELISEQVELKKVS